MARNKIIFRGITYDRITEGNVYLATSPPSTELESNSLSVTVVSDTTALLTFRRNEPLTYHYRGTQIGTFYVQSVQRIGVNQYAISASSAIGLLGEATHYGGIYTGQTLAELVEDISTVPAIVKTSLQNIQIYGHLPIATAQANLGQVLFAVGATVTTDLDGILRIEGIWDGISGASGIDKICVGASVAYGADVTQIDLTEHQYIANPLSDPQPLYDGSTSEGDIITFDTPMFDIVATGFALHSTSANHAVVGAGTGTLIGKPYIHSTRTVSRPVCESSTPNITSVPSATLVSLANSNAVAARLVSYYQCTQTLSLPAVFNGESPGDCRYIYHPYSRELVEACVTSIDITMSNTLKAQENALIGYVPPQIGDLEYFDFCEILDENTTWTVPEGVTAVRVVLIGGGHGGSAGEDGEQADGQTVEVNPLMPSDIHDEFAFGSLGGNGGAGGPGGVGGRLWQETMAVDAGQEFAVTVGAGGPHDSDGSASTFGNLSSQNGTVPTDGFLEIFSDELFCIAGDTGIDGGRGSGEEQAGDTITTDDGSWGPGANNDVIVEDYEGSETSASGFVDGRALGGYGGGPAVGADGQDGRVGSVSLDSDPENGYVYSRGGIGGRGADAVAPSQVAIYGKGGTGGNGGGGGGGSGGMKAKGGVGNSPTSQMPDIQCVLPTPAEGGNGSDGGIGGPGCVILYYSKATHVEDGALMDSSERFFIDRTGRIFVV